jgi:hypothetical protein
VKQYTGKGRVSGSQALFQVKQHPFFRRFITKISGENIRANMPENPLIWEVSGKKCPNWSGKIDLTINGYKQAQKII